MNMKEHILTALREEFHHWEELLLSLSDEQITAPNVFDNWSVKDVMAHLMAWQSRSIARVESALNNRPPEFPKWPANADSLAADTTEQVNAWIYESHRNEPWSKIYQEWKNGFQRFLELSEKIPERDMLDGEKYPWFNEHSLSVFLIGSYDHHQEHLEKLIASLQEKGKIKT